MSRYAKAVLVAALFTIVVLSSAFAGAGAEGAEGAPKMKITFMSQATSAWAFEEISRIFDVEAVGNGVNENDKERVQIMIAASEWPDCGWDRIGVLDGYRQGVHRAIPIDMIRKYAPNYAAMLDRYPIGWLGAQNPDNDKELLALPGVAANLEVNLWHPQMRIDWIRNVGMDLPGYDQNKIPVDDLDRCFFLDADITIDWIEQFLYAVRNGDPDKNGKTGDVIPMGASNILTRSWSPMFGAYGVDIAWGYGNRMIDGKLYTYQIDPGLKEFLLKMAEWYRNDLIDKEFPTLNNVKYWDKIRTQQVAFGCEQLTYAGLPNMMNRPPNVWVPDDEIGTGAEVVMVWPPVGPHGDQGAPRYRALPTAGYDYVVYAQVDDAKLAKILQIINWITTDEGYVAYHNGKPGVHFDWKGEPYNSIPVPRDEADIPAGYNTRGGVSAYPVFRTPERMGLIQTEAILGWYSLALSPKGRQVGTRPYRYNFFADDVYREVNETYGETLDTMFTEMFYKGITGQVDVAAEWDGYVQKWLAAGGRQYLAAIEKFPLMSALDKGKIEY